MKYLSLQRQHGKGDVFGLMSFLSFVFLILACALMGVQVVDNVKADKALAGGRQPAPDAGDTGTGDGGETTTETEDGGEVPGDAPPGDVPPGDVPPGDVPPGDVPPGDVPPADAPPGDVPPADVPPN